METIELENHLIQLTLDYGSQMNELEKDICEKDEKDPTTNYFDEYKKRYKPIFESYCTDKKRVYGGQANSFGIPTKYDGIEDAIEKSVLLKNKNRAEVYFKTNNDFKAEYLFVVLRKNDVWKIDSVKYRFYDKGNWKTQIL